jgi:predicted lactoylglutathione lyase
LEGADDFAVCQAKAAEPATTATHIAFPAEDRDGVDAFHAAAIRAGGREKFPPGLRPEYHSGYYAAFVWDPDGNNVEAVHHGPH